MNCERIDSALVAFHFGTVDDKGRAEVEAHLLACQSCLRSYLALKRDIETAQSGPKPSVEVRDRIRASAARELGIMVRPAPRWERPLAVGFAGLMVVAMLATGLVATGSGAMPGQGAAREGAGTSTP